MKKYSSLVLGLVVACGSVGIASATELQCGENEVLVPAVTHTEEVTQCEFKGEWTFGYNSQCNGQYQFRHSAYHEVTSEIVVVDTPAYCEAVEPEPTDMCPNVTGVQEETPCADTLCEVPQVWNVEGQQCVTPEPEPTPEPETTPSTSSGSTSTGGGGGMCNPNTGFPECQGAANFAYFGMTQNPQTQLLLLYQKLIGVFAQMIPLL